MATRRARIKAIVNVPARRSKVSDDSTNVVAPKSPVAKEIPTADSIGNDEAKREVTQHKEVQSEVELTDAIKGNIAIPEKQSGLTTPGLSSIEDTNCKRKLSEETCAEVPTVCSPIVSAVSEPLTQSADVTTCENPVTACEEGSVSKEGLGDSSTEKVDLKKKSDAASLSSPLKQRARLFIRPSPKLDAGVRGRYPSGNRHKTLSESEDESRNRTTSCTVEDSENPVVETSTRTSQSEKGTDGQDPPVNVTVEKNTLDSKKNGTVRSGRQRTRNKENRVSDEKRRLWLQLKKGNGEGLDRSRLTMFDYIYYNPISNPMRSNSESSDAGRGRKTSVSNSERSTALLEEQVDDPGEGNNLETGDGGQEDRNECDEGGGMPAPRVKVGPDGELIVDEQSLVIETTGLREGREDLEKGPALVESSSFTNYATYSKRSKGLEWSENETLLFYRALTVVGTDFSLMQNVLFPKRSRRDLKNKFKREERRNPGLVEKALSNPEIFSSVEDLQIEFAKTVAAAEKEKEELKKAKGRPKGEGPTKRKAEKKSEKKPAKKRKWAVSGGVSDGDSESEMQESTNSSLLEFPDNETEIVQLPPEKVVTSSVDDDITMCSQEIVVTDRKTLADASDESESERSHVKEESDGEESVSNESQFFSRVLVPTRSGRVPKVREINSGHQVSQLKVDISSTRSKSGAVEGVNIVNNAVVPVGKEMEMIICSKEAEDSPHEPSKDPLAVELTRFPSTSAVGNDFVNKVEPGSLVVIATCAPDNPTRQVLQLFMVSPDDVKDGGHVLIPQNLSSTGKVASIEDNTQPVESFGSSTVVSVKNPTIEYPYNSVCEELSSCTIVVEDSDATKV
ncbi:transcription factor TFIIIB component B'' [Ischnura elegans]|uniref:transcription factor TFIIIB component B'' n=1 Tax=Ischnura elegans TaxID=197161 RepID=UPI001ED885A9|nr:transcription factor TFIIIB component B'' [Ischnura elegans]